MYFSKKLNANMKIRVFQFNPTIGDIKGNLEKIRSAYRQASDQGMDLLILSELILSGYPPMDLLERKAFLSRIFDANLQLVAETNDKTALLFGTVTPNSGSGRPIFNSAILAFSGEIAGLSHKSLLPTYDVFDDFRYFEAARTVAPISYRGIKFGVTICEDIWNHENEFVYHKYDRDIVGELKEQGAEIIVNVSASPFAKAKPELREQMLRNHALKHGLPIIYANQVGANTEVIFDGHSQLMNAQGQMLCNIPLFEEGSFDLEWNSSGLRVLEGEKTSYPKKPERLFQALVLGVRDYLQKTSVADSVVLGLSGGIDSALVAVIAAEALGAHRVHAVMMPSMFSSEGSVTDARKLAQNLGIHARIIPVKHIYDTFIGALADAFKGTEFGIAEENLQSRSRGVLLMALSNKFGHLLLNTGNKSEMAVGYCTLYGDMAGGVSVLSDVYKTEVFEMCRWLNEEFYGREIIPEAIITKPPSAELRPDQKDTDSLPPYDVLDAILLHYIEDQMQATEIIKAGYDEETVYRIIRMVDLNEYKRRQAAPGLRVSVKAFGYGRRLPIVQQWTGHERA